VLAKLSGQGGGRVEDMQSLLGNKHLGFFLILIRLVWSKAVLEVALICSISMCDVEGQAARQARKAKPDRNIRAAMPIAKGPYCREATVVSGAQRHYKNKSAYLGGKIAPEAPHSSPFLQSH